VSLETIEAVSRWNGGLFGIFVFALIFVGIFQGTRRPVGKTMGSSPGLLHSPLFYIAAGTVFFGVCILLWRPLPLNLPKIGRIAALILGFLLYFPGMVLTMWGRLVLGKMYFVSTGMEAQLFTDHRLVTHGPFAIVRHPIYLGLTIAAVGGLFLFQTWAMFIFLMLPFGLARRALIEEQLLAEAFGGQWLAYCQRVPAWWPRLRIESDKSGKDSPT